MAKTILKFSDKNDIGSPSAPGAPGDPGDPGAPGYPPLRCAQDRLSADIACMSCWVMVLLIAAEVPLINRQLGLDVLKAALGKQQPTGRGVVVGHVEGAPVSRYMPRVEDRQFRRVKFIPESGRSQAHDHAHATARMIYGSVGLAPGVSRVHCYASRDWLGGACLGLGTPYPPKPGPAKVMNHSWISHAGGVEDVLRRADYLVDQHDVILVAGVNNGGGTAVPSLLASAYNAIAVGNWQGDSSSSYTLHDGKGRCKPDLVAPGGKTSYATPVVTAMAARLLEGAQGDAQRAQVIKAVLMAGADKPDGWKREVGRPLSKFYGAGRVRLDQSYYMLQNGPASGRIDTRYGWGFVKVEAGASATWELSLPGAAKEISIVAVWHRRIDGQTTTDVLTARPIWQSTATMADFDLAFSESHELAASRSRIDNVEHIYVKDLAAGKYRLELSREDELDEAWEAAVAWRIEG